MTLDIGAVTAWIAGLDLGERPPLRFRRIGIGYSNLTFLVSDTDGRSWVLRRPPLGELLGSAHDIAREQRILSALAPTPVPVPRIFGLCEDPGISPVPLVLMEYLDGLVIDSIATAEELTPEVRGAAGRALPRGLAQIHAVDLELTGLDRLSRSSTPYAARQIKRWRGQWQQSRTRDLPLIEELGDRLWAAMPQQRETTLVHGDFHLLNMIFSPTDGELRGILDWELCTLGDPLADLGGLLAYWPGPDEEPGPLLAFAGLEGFPSGAEIASTYGEASGRSLADLGFWQTLGIWKIAIITEGILRRMRSDAGNASLGRPPRREEVERLLERGRAVADAAGI